MKLVTFQNVERTDRARLGALLKDGQVLDLAAAGKAAGAAMVDDMQSLIEGGERLWDTARRLIEISPADAVESKYRLLSPLPRPIRLRDCSLFLEHMKVAMAKVARERGDQSYVLPPIYDEQVIYYNADHLHIYGDGDDIPWPRHSDWMDYELEWACVIGPGGSNISREAASRHIFGYTIFNDWSARDLQLPFMTANLGPGEGKDFANSLGPCIATADEFDDPYACPMEARVNGELWSSGSTSSMHHLFEDAIVQFSRDKQLFAGEILASGTVLSGCGYELGRKLADGDRVALSVGPIGTLSNRIIRKSDQ